MILDPELDSVNREPGRQRVNFIAYEDQSVFFGFHFGQNLWRKRAFEVAHVSYINDDAPRIDFAEEDSDQLFAVEVVHIWGQQSLRVSCFTFGL
jgi:hypothetical protein